MIKSSRKDGLSVNCFAGTYVVGMGINFEDGKPRKGCLGFAIQREDHTENERYWMSGSKTFKETEPKLGPGGKVSSRNHPFQTFQWCDYSAKPAHDYTYTVVPLFGKPETLQEGTPVYVRIQTEPEHGKKHSVFFNRAAASSQEYARRFHNKKPSEVGEAAYKWLSRGLLEAFVTFVKRAQGPDYGLYGAFYEFQWPAALEALKAAAKTGAKLQIVYDGIPSKTGPCKKNEAAIADARLGRHCVARTTGKLMHNKFLVLTRKGKAIAVWSGSTNLTENGIFGHSNCAHIIEDADIAEAYLEYWKELKSDPDSKSEKEWMAKKNPAPPDPWDDDLEHVFSPHKGLSVLEWYAKIATGPKPLFMTFAFGMHKDFQKVYEQKDGVLRFALMEKEGNGSGLEQGKKDIARIRKQPNVVVALGHNITTNCFDRWLKEPDKITAEANVRWIHTKYMLIDPLGTNPIVVIGSANFSEASTSTNNENMMIIRNEPRVAHIYLSEFLRLYSSYAFREAVAIAKENGEEWEPKWLVSNDTWQKNYFQEGDPRYLRRAYFAAKRARAAHV